MVQTQSLKYSVFLFFTFGFNLLTTSVYALNIGAETTGVAVSVVCILINA
jgi:secretory phospholipase A2